MEESLSSEHSSELLSDSLEHLLDGSGVTDEGGGHLETVGWDVTDGGLDVVGNPLDEVRRVLVLDVQHLLVDFLGGNPSSKHSRSSQISTVSWVGGAHHVFGVEHLLGQFSNIEVSVLLGSSGGEWSESNHEEVESWEWDQVGGQLSEVRVELTWESETTGDSRHGSRDQVVQVTIGWGGQFQGSEADVIKGLVVDDHDFV